MASQQTPNYKLSRWAGTDRILVEEFNDNWDKLDTALAKRNCQFYTASYTGDGEATKTWTFPAKPVFIILISSSEWFMGMINAREGHGWSQLGGNRTTTLSCSVNENRATWNGATTSPSDMGNGSDVHYELFAILEAE